MAKKQYKHYSEKTVVTGNEIFLIQNPDGTYNRVKMVRVTDALSLKTINGESIVGTGEIPATSLQSDWNQSDNSKADFIKNKPVFQIVPGNTRVSGGNVFALLMVADDEKVATPINLTYDTFNDLFQFKTTDDRSKLIVGNDIDVFYCPVAVLQVSSGFCGVIDESGVGGYVRAKLTNGTYGIEFDDTKVEILGKKMICNTDNFIVGSEKTIIAVDDLLGFQVCGAGNGIQFSFLPAIDSSEPRCGFFHVAEAPVKQQKGTITSSTVTSGNILDAMKEVLDALYNYGLMRV